MLPSGLPDIVGDDEEVTRFLTQSSQYKALMPKPSAFLPNPKYKNTSVFRVGNDPEMLRQIWQITSNGERILKAAAVCKTAEVRNAGLDVIAIEPPDAHANIEGWEWLDNDPELQKAQQKEIAEVIAQKSTLVML
jgi:hypothetical protein